MELPEAVNQLKIMRKNLTNANVEYMSPATIQFRLKSIEAIDLIVKEMEGKNGGTN